MTPIDLRPISEGYCDACGEDVSARGLRVWGQSFCGLCQIECPGGECRLTSYVEYYCCGEPEQDFLSMIEGSVLWLVEKFGYPDTPEGWLNFMQSEWMFCR